MTSGCANHCTTAPDSLGTGMTIRQTTVNHHNHRKLHQTTTNHHQNLRRLAVKTMKSRQTTANHHQNTSKKESNCQFCGLNLAMARRNIIYLCHSCCLHGFSICNQLFYIEKHWVFVAPPIEYAWCQFKMTSSKCPSRSKHQVISLTVYIYISP